MKYPFAVFLTSYGLSMLGNSIAAVVLPLLVLQTTGSALNTGAVSAATAVPAVLAGLFMGGVVDRVHRRSVSIVTDLISAASVAALPIVDAVTDLSLGWFVLFGVIGSFGDVPGLTAREALAPAVAHHSGVSVERLVALRESVGAVVMIAGPAAGAGLVMLVDGSAALWFTAGTSFAAAAITLLLPRDVGAISSTSTAHSAGTALSYLREGWSVLFRRSPFLLSVTMVNLVLVSVLAAIQGLLLPVHLTEQHQQGQLGLVLSFVAAGMLVGAGGFAVASQRLPRRVWFLGGLVGSIVGITVIALLPAIGVLLAGAVVVGASGGLLSAVVGVLMLERIPDDLRGRITGTQNAILTAAPSIGVMGSAVAVEYSSLRSAGLILVGVWLLTAVVALAAPPLRDLEPRRQTVNA